MEGLFRGRIEKVFFREDTEGDSSRKSFTRIHTSKEVPINEQGLENSHDWHQDRQVVQRETLKQPTDRAILCQSKGNIEDILNHFGNVDNIENSLTIDASFAENLFITGDMMNSTHICIGDIFHIIRDSNIKGVVQVSNPRRPCFKIDMKHRINDKSKFNKEGVRAYCARTGNAGWFFRVLKGGSLQAGDELVLVERIHPDWTVKRTSDVIYGGCADSYQISKWKPEFDELIENKEFGYFEWKELLLKFRDDPPKPKPNNINDDSKRSIEISVNQEEEVRFLGMRRWQFQILLCIIGISLSYILL